MKGRASPGFDLRPCELEIVAELVGEHHGYGSMGASATYAFAVYEDGKVVAAYSWQPPPVGAAKSVCPEEHGGVLALSRMVALPRDERRLRHVSKCSGFEKTTRRKAPFFLSAEGKRASSYSNGKHGSRELTRGGTTTIQRWEHWACPRGEVVKWMTEHGWQRVALPGRVWKSGNQAHKWRKL